MDLLQKLGGRKFIMGLVVIGAGMFLEAKTAQGLSPTMAAFLGSIVAAFSVANITATANHNASRKNGGVASGPDQSLHDKVDELSAVVAQGLSKEAMDAMLQVLTKQMNDIDDVKKVTGQIGVNLVNLLKR